MRELEASKAGIAERIKLLKAPTAISIHPNFIDQYLLAVRDLREILESGSNAARNRAAFRNMIDRIVVHQVEGRDYEVSVYGRPSALMGVNLFPPMRSPREILREEGVTRSDIGNQD
jgi:hypothetical protein